MLPSAHGASLCRWSVEPDTVITDTSSNSTQLYLRFHVLRVLRLKVIHAILCNKQHFEHHVSSQTAEGSYQTELVSKEYRQKLTQTELT